MGQNKNKKKVSNNRRNIKQENISLDDNKYKKNKIIENSVVQTKENSEETTTKNRAVEQRNTKPNQKTGDITAINNNLSNGNSKSDETTAVLTQQNQNSTTEYYGPRKIVSNWRKYELPVDTTERTATDFNSLLQMAAASSSSHFRFKDELDWTDLSDDHKVTLNLQNVATALSCIPLHRRLGIDPDVFEDDRVNSFISEASLQKAKLNTTSVPSNKVQSSRHDIPDIVLVTQQCSDDICDSGLDKCYDEDRHDSGIDVDKLSSRSDSIDDSNKQSCHVDEDALSNACVKSTEFIATDGSASAKQQSVSASLAELEDELDELLSL